MEREILMQNAVRSTRVRPVRRSALMNHIFCVGSSQAALSSDIRSKQSNRRLGTLSFASPDYFFSRTSLFHEFPRYYNEVKKQRTGSTQGGFITRETRSFLLP